MNNRIYCAIVAAMLLSCGLSVRADDTLESVERKLVARWERLDSLSANMRMTATVSQYSQRIEATGTFAMLRLGGKPLSRTEMTTQSSMGEGEASSVLKTQMMQINDGNYTYLLQTIEGRSTAVRMSPRKAQQMGGREMFVLLHADHELSLKPEEMIAERPMHVIEAIPRRPNPRIPVRNILLYFDQITGILIKSVLYGPDGNPVTTMKFTGIRINPRLDPDQFVFRAPDDVTIVDEADR